MNTKPKNGFTLIELLVVVAIISLVSSVVVLSLTDTRERAKISAAQSELDNIRRAVEHMKTDTGTLPGGCTPGEGQSNILLPLTVKQSGLTEKPSVGTVTGVYSNGPLGPCEWTVDEVTSWDGPYISKKELQDPWNHPYLIDTQFIISPEPSDPNAQCPQSVTNSKYTGRGPKIYSQAVWTRSLPGYSFFDVNNPSSYPAFCDAVWEPTSPQK
jgi:prepilin-type N-terminal cleavage/methylation domain-containing protein